MMAEPPIDEVLEKVDSNFTLVAESSKRARQLLHGAECTVACDSVKPISMATYEIYNGAVTYSRDKE